MDGLINLLFGRAVTLFVFFVVGLNSKFDMTFTRHSRYVSSRERNNSDDKQLISPVLDDGNIDQVKGNTWKQYFHNE